MTPAAQSWPRFAAAGAGRMGRSIALAFAWAGYRISLVDLKHRPEPERARLAADIDAELRAQLAALVDLGALGDVDLECQRLAAFGVDLPGGVLDARLVDVGADHVRAFACKDAGGGTADAAAGAGDEGGAVVEGEHGKKFGRKTASGAEGKCAFPAPRKACSVPRIAAHWEA